MMQIAMRAAWLLMLLACAVMTGDAARGAGAGGTGAATQPATTRTTAGVAFVAGKLSFAIADDRVHLTARGDGWSGPWGDVVAAEATWSPTIDNVMALLAGQIDELSIATGTFTAEFSNGDTLGGTISGTVRPGEDQTFGLQAKFIATHGTGRFAGVSGGGTLRAIDSLDTLEFRAMLNAKLHVPR
jgi:hypothetical protein